MTDVDLSEIRVGDLVLAYRDEDIQSIVHVTGIYGGKIDGHVVNGQYPIMFDVATGHEAVERREMPDPRPSENPFYTAFLRGNWAAGMRIMSTMRLPDSLIEEIKHLDALMEEANYRQCLELFDKHGSCVTEALKLYKNEMTSAAAPGMR